MERKDLQEILDKELKVNQITVRKWSAGSCGSAYGGIKREVKIPKPIDVDTLGVCFHEIAHVVLGQCEGGWQQNIPVWKQEYTAEQYAINKLKEYKLDENGIKEFEERARRHVTMIIAKAFCRKLKLDRVSEEVKTWCKVDFTQWEGNKVFVENWETNKGELKITFS